MSVVLVVRNSISAMTGRCSRVVEGGFSRGLVHDLQASSGRARLNTFTHQFSTTSQLLAKFNLIYFLTICSSHILLFFCATLRGPKPSIFISAEISFKRFITSIAVFYTAANLLSLNTPCEDTARTIKRSALFEQCSFYTQTFRPMYGATCLRTQWLLATLLTRSCALRWLAGQSTTHFWTSRARPAVTRLLVLTWSSTLRSRCWSCTRPRENPP
jgi:hypothetical protein